jgi:hypothetical protein
VRSTAAGLLFAFLLVAGTPHTTALVPRTHNVVLVTLDGVRVEEIFGGLDVAVLRRTLEPRTSFAESPAYRKYGASTRDERRRRLMPFFWGTLMRQHGSIAGDRHLGSSERLRNRHRVSYPGYSEILTGQAHDDVITSNDFGQNPYPSVLELLKQRLGLGQNEVAAFASWPTIERIAEHRRGTVFIDAGRAEYEHHDARLRRLSRRQFEAPATPEETRPDEHTFALALAHLRTHRPRVLFIGFDETDRLAHEGRYPEVLDALAEADRRLQRLWDALQSDPFYRDRTSLLLTVDHGRGRDADLWHEHGPGIEGAQDVWTAFVVPESRRRGPWSSGPALYHDQLAATLAHLMGVDYAAENPAAGRPIAALFASDAVIETSGRSHAGDMARR